jgi:hypothetical protein
MAQEEDILQRIVLEGDKAVISQLNNIGDGWAGCL